MLHLAGGRVDVSAAPDRPAASALGLVCLALRGRLDAAALAAALRDAAR